MPDADQDVRVVEAHDAPEVEVKEEDEEATTESTDEDQADDAASVSRTPILITNHNSEGTLNLPITVENAEGEVREVTVDYIEDDVETHKVLCPNCHEKKQWHKFFLRRISTRYVQWLMPFIIEHAATSSHDASLPKHGQKLITFTDSRQGTAKMGALLEREGQRSLTVTETYRKLSEEQGTVLKPEEKAWYESVLASPIANQVMKAEAERKLKPNPEIRWDDMIERLVKTLPREDYHDMPTHHLRQAFLDLYEDTTERAKVKNDNDCAKRIANILLLREFLYRPKNGPSLETCGLISVVYPSLATIKEDQVPHEWPKCFGLEGWKQYLKLAIDNIIRARFAVELPDDWWQVGGNIRVSGKRYISPYAKDEKSTNRRMYWPTVAKTPSHSRDFVKYTAKLLGYDLEGTVMLTVSDFDTKQPTATLRLESS